MRIVAKDFEHRTFLKEKHESHAYLLDYLTHTQRRVSIKDLIIQMRAIKISSEFSELIADTLIGFALSRF